MGPRLITVFVIVFTVFIINICYAQLTFTPNWGKRSAINQLDFAGNAQAATLNNGNSGGGIASASAARSSANLNGNNNNCKPSIDSLMLIYRMIQAEAEKIDDCLQK